MNWSKSAWTSAPDCAALDHAVELGQHLPGPLQHLGRSVGDGRLELGEGVAGQFRPLPADPVEKLPQPGHVPAGTVPETLLHQAAQRLVGVAVLEQVVHQTAQDVVAVQVAVLLAAVPAGVPCPCHAQFASVRL